MQPNPIKMSIYTGKPVGIPAKAYVDLLKHRQPVPVLTIPREDPGWDRGLELTRMGESRNDARA